MLGRRPKKSPQAKGQGAAVAKQVRKAKGRGDAVAKQVGKPPTPTVPKGSLVRTSCCCSPARLSHVLIRYCRTVKKLKLCGACFPAFFFSAFFLKVDISHAAVEVLKEATML